MALPKAYRDIEDWFKETGVKLVDVEDYEDD